MATRAELLALLADLEAAVQEYLDAATSSTIPEPNKQEQQP